jgi:hypothetical protein
MERKMPTWSSISKFRLDQGFPALAVAGSQGELLVSQKNGEFEDARGLTPEALVEFFE